MAGWDADALDRLRHWPLRDLLLAWLDKLRQEARQHYALDLQVWAALAPHQEGTPKPPKLPRILRS